MPSGLSPWTAEGNLNIPSSEGVPRNFRQIQRTKITFLKHVRGIFFQDSHNITAAFSQGNLRWSIISPKKKATKFAVQFKLPERKDLQIYVFIPSINLLKSRKPTQPQSPHHFPWKTRNIVYPLQFHCNYPNLEKNAFTASNNNTPEKHNRLRWNLRPQIYIIPNSIRVIGLQHVWSTPTIPNRFFRSFPSLKSGYDRNSQIPCAFFFFFGCFGIVCIYIFALSQSGDRLWNSNRPCHVFRLSQKLDPFWKRQSLLRKEMQSWPSWKNML